MNDVQADEIVALISEPAFGSVIAMMVSRQFQRVDGRAGPSHKFYTECRFCQGTDIIRPEGERTSISLVRHYDDCLLGRYLPAIRNLSVLGAAPRRTS